MPDLRDQIPVLRPGLDIAKPGNPQPEIDEVTRKLYADSLPKTVQIVTDEGVGSGFFMDRDGRIGTAAHVVLGSREHYAITSDGTKYKLQIEKMDDINDAAIMRPIGFKPGSRPFAEMGSSKDLKPDDPIYPIGHPQGLRPAYISPGYFRGTLSQQELFKTQEPNIDEHLKEALKNLTPNELPEMKAALARDLLSGSVHIRPGDSGGPMFTLKGKVVGINDMISDFKNGYFVPVEKIQDLYNAKENKFDFTYSRVAAPWAQEYKNTWRESPVVAAGQTLTGLAAGYVGYRAISYLPRPLGISASAIEGVRLISDSEKLLSSTDPMDKLKYGIASASDLTGMIGGLALMSSRYRVGGAIGLAVGITAHLASDFIPNRLLLSDLQRRSNPLLPPLDPNIEKSLGL